MSRAKEELYLIANGCQTEKQISEWTKRFDKSSIERTYEKITKIKLGIHQNYELQKGKVVK